MASAQSIEKNKVIQKLRELLHTQSHTEHDLWRLSTETLKTLIERVEHVRTRALNEGACTEPAAMASAWERGETP